MRIQRVPVTDIPHGELVLIVRKPGRTPAVLLNAGLITEAQAVRLARRLRADPDLLNGLGGDGV